MNRWQAVIFDLDDTLYPEREYVLSGFWAVAQWADLNLGVHREQGYADLCQLYYSGVRGNTFNLWLQQLGFEKDLVAALVRVYREHEPQIRPFPEVRPLLSRLRKTCSLGLLSDGYLEVQKRKLAALGLADCFDTTLFTDELGREYWKPNSKSFREVLLRLRINEPNVAVYVGDNPLKDFLGARNIGMYTIWLRRSDGEYANREPPTEAHCPHETVGTITELTHILLPC